MASLDTRSPYKLAGAAGAGYSLASVWESTASLSDSQLDAVACVASALSTRPLPPGLPAEVAEAKAQATDEKTSPLPSSLAPTNPDAKRAPLPPEELSRAVLHSTSDFYAWLSSLEAVRDREADGASRRYASSLASYVGACEGVSARATRIGERLALLTESQRRAEARALALQGVTDRLFAERARVGSLAEAVGAKLRHFEEMEGAEARVAAAALAADPEPLLETLRRLDAAAAFVAANPRYAGSADAGARLRALHARALAAARSRIHAALRLAVRAALGDKGGDEEAEMGSLEKERASHESGAGSEPASASDSVSDSASRSVSRSASASEASRAALATVRYRSVAEPALRPLVAGLRALAAERPAPGYARALLDAQEAHCAARAQLARPGVQAALARARAAGLGLGERLEEAVQALAGLHRVEQALFRGLFGPSEGAVGDGGGDEDAAEPEARSFTPQPSNLASSTTSVQPRGATFPPPHAATSPLWPFFEPLCTLVYDSLRPGLVSARGVGDLARLTRQLQAEHLRPGSGPAALEPLLRRLLADAQERLTFRAQAFVREDIAGFQPLFADLDYPGRLLGDVGEEETGDERVGAPPEQAPAVLYEPVRRTMAILTELDGLVDASVFGGLAHEALQAAVRAVQAGAKVLAGRSPEKEGAAAGAAAPPAPPPFPALLPGGLDSLMFEVVQLLALRQLLAGFHGADFSVMDRALDFSHVRDSLRRTLTGQLPLFALSSRSAVVQLVAPRVSESASDARAGVESALKAACERLILVLTRLGAEPLLGFLTKVTAVQVQQLGAPGDDSGEAPSPEPWLLKRQAFATPERLRDLLQGAAARLQADLPAALDRLALHLPAPETRQVLVAPVLANVAEAVEQLGGVLEREYAGEEVCVEGKRLRELLCELQ